MLHTVDKAVSSSDGKVLANPTYQNDAALPLYRTYFWKIPSWTIVTFNMFYRGDLETTRLAGLRGEERESYHA
jgi:hypothetical protein